MKNYSKIGPARWRKMCKALGWMALVFHCGLCLAGPVHVSKRGHIHRGKVQFLPSGWSEQDIGSVSTAGSSTYNAGTGIFTVSGGGSDIAGTADAFHFAYKPLTGNFTIVARVDSSGGAGVNGGAASGIMVRESLNANSRHELLYIEPGGTVRTRMRITTGGPTISNAAGASGYPRWMKLQRYGEQITLLQSTDSVNWVNAQGQVLIGLSSTVYVGLAVTSRNNTSGVLNTARFSNVNIGPLNTTIGTSWLGNSYAGGKRYVQFRVGALAVSASNGNLFLNGESESYSSTIFDTNGNFTAYANSSHFNGGEAAAWDATNSLVYYAQFLTHGVAYYSTAGILGGVILNGRTIHGLTISGNELFAVDDANVTTPADSTVTVHVFSLSTKTETRSFLLPKLARNIVAEASGNLWVVFTKDGTHSPVIRHYSNTGSLLSGTISGLGDPKGIAIDPSGNVYIADNGVDQQIKVYSSTGTFVRALGAQFGIYSGTKGAVDATKLDHPVALAIDNGGNLYVSCIGPGNQWGGGGSGTVLRKYTSLTSLTTTSMSWERVGLEYVDCASADPTTDAADVYTKNHHYQVDFSGATPAWTYKGQLLDDMTYPNDPRLKSERCGVWVKVINGKKMLIDNDQQGGQINFYRFQSGSEITIPYATFTRETARGQPTNALSIWIDANLNGVVDPGETDTAGQALGAPSNETYAWHIDSLGNVWTMGGGNNTIGGVRQPTLIWCFKVTSSGGGYPVYSSANNDHFSLPSEFTGTNTYVLRLHYVNSTDVLYVSGYTATNPKPDTRFGFIGREIIRYNNWRGIAGSRALAYRIVVPYSTTDGTKCMDIVDDAIATVTGVSCRVNLYKSGDGTLLKTFLPGPEVSGDQGLLDMNNGLTMYKRSNRKRLIFVEEDAEIKVLMYYEF